MGHVRHGARIPPDGLGEGHEQYRDDRGTAGEPAGRCGSAGAGESGRRAALSVGTRDRPRHGLHHRVERDQRPVRSHRRQPGSRVAVRCARRTGWPRAPRGLDRGAEQRADQRRAVPGHAQLAPRDRPRLHDHVRMPARRAGCCPVPQRGGPDHRLGPHRRDRVGGPGGERRHARADGHADLRRDDTRPGCHDREVGAAADRRDGAGDPLRRPPARAAAQPRSGRRPARPDAGARRSESCRPARPAGVDAPPLLGSHDHPAGRAHHALGQRDLGAASRHPATLGGRRCPGTGPGTLRDRRTRRGRLPARDPRPVPHRLGRTPPGPP